MIRVESFPHETPAMFQARFEKEIAYLEAIDPGLAEQHRSQVVSDLRWRVAEDTVELGFWATVFIVIMGAF